MDTSDTLNTRLTQILAGFAQWQGSIEEATHLMTKNKAILDEVANHSAHHPETEALAQQVMTAYEVFLRQLKSQQQVIKQELARLNRPNSLVKTYLQQEDAAAFVEFDI